MAMPMSDAICSHNTWAVLGVETRAGEQMRPGQYERHLMGGSGACVTTART